jgi:hypothetical protein
MLRHDGVRVRESPFACVAPCRGVGAAAGGRVGGRSGGVGTKDAGEDRIHVAQMIAEVEERPDLLR